jgi:thymidylate synthase ThyX
MKLLLRLSKKVADYRMAKSDERGCLPAAWYSTIFETETLEQLQLFRIRIRSPESSQVECW